MSTAFKDRSPMQTESVDIRKHVHISIWNYYCVPLCTVTGVLLHMLRLSRFVLGFFYGHGHLFEQTELV